MPNTTANKTAPNRVKTTRKRKRKNPSDIGISLVKVDDRSELLRISKNVVNTLSGADYRGLLKIIPKEVVLSLFGFGDINVKMFSGLFKEVMCPDSPHNNIVYGVMDTNKPSPHLYDRIVQLFKCGKSISSDNIFYEYITGVCCVNRLREYFPIFNRTTGLWKVTASIHNQLLKNCGAPHVKISGITPVNITYSDVCIGNRYLAVTSDYLPMVISFYTGMWSGLPDIITVLFQIYYTLYCCRNVFTHGDLHGNNIALVPLVGKNCIEYVYHAPTMSGGSRVIRFKSKYIVKLIDYARSRFKGYTPTGQYINSKMVTSELWNADPMCATNGWTISAIFGISSYRNMSMDDDSVLDTWLIQTISNLRNNGLVKLIPGLYKILSLYNEPDNEYDEYKVDKDFPIDPYLFKVENKPSTYPKKITTKKDVYFAVLDAITKRCPIFKQIPLDYINNLYSGYNVIATVEVFGVGDKWTYTPNGSDPVFPIGHDGIPIK